MTVRSESPVFCDSCSSLAVAELDTALLCTDCLLGELERAADREAAIAAIRPIEVRPPMPPRAVAPQVACVLPRDAHYPRVA